MNRLLILILVFVSLLLFLACPLPTDSGDSGDSGVLVEWEMIGTSNFTNEIKRRQLVGSPTYNNSTHSSIIVDGDKVYAGYIRNAGSPNYPEVQVWDGSSWSILGNNPISPITEKAGNFSMQFLNGVPYVGYESVTSPKQGIVKKYNSTTDSWDAIGGHIVETDISGMSLLVVSDNDIYTGFIADAYADVYRWNGTSWTQVIHHPEAYYGVKLAYDSGKYFSTLISTHPWKIYLAESTDGTNWTDIGDGDTVYAGFVNDGVLPYKHNIDAYNGEPYVAFSDEEYNGKASVAKWNGSNYEIVGTQGFSGREVIDLNIRVIDENNIFVGVSELDSSIYKPCAYMWDGSNWIMLSGDFISDEYVTLVSMDVNDNGDAYIFYRNEITEKGTAWKTNFLE